MTQHRLLVMDVEIKSFNKKKRSVGESKVQWWSLMAKMMTKLAKKIKAKGQWRLEGNTYKM